MSTLLALILATLPVEFDMPVEHECELEVRPEEVVSPSPTYEVERMGFVLGLRFDGKWTFGVKLIMDDTVGQYQTTYEED